MWQKIVVVTAVITCWCLLIEAQPQYSFALKRSTAKYCSTMLTDMLALVCGGEYNRPSFKRSEDGDSTEDYVYGHEYMDDSSDTRLAYPYRPRQNAASLIPGTFRRYSRGIVDECCKKACTVSELKSYCLNP